jgi:hypothetical protein
VPSLGRLTRKGRGRAVPRPLLRLARCLPTACERGAVPAANSFDGPSWDISRVGADMRGTPFAILVYQAHHPSAAEPAKEPSGNKRGVRRPPPFLSLLSADATVPFRPGSAARDSIRSTGARAV